MNQNDEIKLFDSDDSIKRTRTRPRPAGHSSSDSLKRKDTAKNPAARNGSAQHPSSHYPQTASRSSGSRSPYPPSSRQTRRRKKRRMHLQPRFFLLLMIFLVALALLVVLARAIFLAAREKSSSEPKDEKAGLFSELFKTPTPTPTPSPTPTPTPTPTPPYPIPSSVDSSRPSNWGLGVKVESNGEVVESYSRMENLAIEHDEIYSRLPGIITFRGNQFRDNAAYGIASVLDRKLSLAWSVQTGELGRSDVGGPTNKTWTGSGWVGQPLIVQWPEPTKQIMNLYDSAKSKTGLIEVIYATMDGNIYFLDLETGRPTRDKMYLGMPFKGAGALDPRGYPILYLGSGDMYVSDSQKSRAMVISLIDCSVLYEFGKQNDPFSLRDWHAYDSSPLVDADTDTLIYPGENGILYTIKLNTQYNEAAGTLSINPTDFVKMRYAGSRSTYPESASNLFWLGYESSIAVLGHYGYLATNDGFLQCIDLNTMSLVWAQDTLDDSNGSPVMELDPLTNHAYIYVGPSLHFTADSKHQGTIPFLKVDASTGEIVWKYELPVFTKSGVSGGIQATALLGQKSISDLVIIPFARTPEENSGVLVALDKNTGSVRWQYNMNKYTWSSPIAVYDEAGNAYIIVCEGSDSGSHIFLLEGTTGTLLNTFNSEMNIEASPAAFNNLIVVGTRGMKILGIRIS